MKEEIKQRAEQLASAISGIESTDALDVLGEGLRIATKNGCKHAPILPIWYIGKLIEGMNGEKAVIKIKDGGVSFEIFAGKEKKLSI